MTAALSQSDLRFINLVAARRFAGGDPGPVDAAVLDEAVAEGTTGTPFARAARLAATLLRRQVFSSAPLHTALLVMHCSLTLDGLSLLAPQGVLAGMIGTLASGDDVAAVERWLEDRAVPSASGE